MSANSVQCVAGDKDKSFVWTATILEQSFLFGVTTDVTATLHRAYDPATGWSKSEIGPSLDLGSLAKEATVTDFCFFGAPNIAYCEIVLSDKPLKANLRAIKLMNPAESGEDAAVNLF